jgi:hypothetical protein
LISPSQVHLELSLLSISYLNFNDVSLRKSRQEVRDSLLAGRYGFYDYAVACWFPHLMSWLSDGQLHDASVAELQEALDPFLDEHFCNLGERSIVSKTMHDKFEAFSQADIYDRLTQAVVWSRKQLLVDSSHGAKAAVLDFPEITHHVRSVLEETIRGNPSSEVKAALELYYGDRLFKCPMIYCRHFYNGFESQEARDRHISRHRRAYICTHEGCPTATFGCISKKDLNKHMLESHGISDDAEDFPSVPNPNPSSVSFSRATFQCTLCPKRFTRAFNLRSHLRTHTDERPFVCQVCGKAFSRNHDRKTHEMLHSGMKRFTCKGELERGGHWGCGHKFARADALARHLGSDVGSMCIKPLLEEETLKRQGLRAADWNAGRNGAGPGPGMTPQPISTSALGFSYNTDPATQRGVSLDHGFFGHPLSTAEGPSEQGQGPPDESGLNEPFDFPAAILAQYPALRGPQFQDDDSGGQMDLE